MQTVLIIGATGDVGRGICTVLLEAGYHVIAASRGGPRLTELRNGLAARASGGRLDILEGSVESEARAAQFRDAALKLADGNLHAVVASINGPTTIKPLLESSTEELTGVINANLVSHFIAAKTFIPAIAKGGMYMSIGGGMTDFVVPGYGMVSTCQGAQRNMFRMISREARGGPVAVRELLLYSMIAGESKRDKAEASWLTDEDCGRHVLAVLRDPQAFAGPILALRSREQVGKPEPEAAKSR